MNEAFNGLKVALTLAPVLASLFFRKAIEVEMEASSCAVGAMVGQKGKDGKIHPVQLTSRTMEEEEKRYTTSEREVLAGIFALKKFRLYLLSTNPLQLITNHQSLQYGFKQKDVHWRLARWLKFLSECLRCYTDQVVEKGS